MLREPGSDDPDNPLVPVAVEDDRTLGCFQPFIHFDHLNRLLCGQHIQVFPFSIVIFNLLPELKGLLEMLTNK